MPAAEVALQAIFGALAVVGIIASLHYRESLCCIFVRILRPHQVLGTSLLYSCFSER